MSKMPSFRKNSATFTCVCTMPIIADNSTCRLAAILQMMNTLGWVGGNEKYKRMDLKPKWHHQQPPFYSSPPTLNPPVCQIPTYH